VQSIRNKRAALRLMRKLMKKQGMAPAILVTDRRGAYPAAVRELGRYSFIARDLHRLLLAGLPAHSH
jgi:transposase-like protein